MGFQGLRFQGLLEVTAAHHQVLLLLLLLLLSQGVKLLRRRGAHGSSGATIERTGHLMGRHGRIGTCLCE